MDGGDLPNVTDAGKPRLYLLQWLKSDRALMMLFNDGTFQVNFYHDHTKIILCNQSEEYLLTYINEDRVSTTLRLSTLLVSGCSPDLRTRMDYALDMLLQRCNWTIRAHKDWDTSKRRECGLLTTGRESVEDGRRWNGLRVLQKDWAGLEPETMMKSRWWYLI